MTNTNFKHVLTDIDDCSPNPCEHGGSCTDGVNSYDCDCLTGYTGVNCQTGTKCIQLVCFFLVRYRVFYYFQPTS